MKKRTKNILVSLLVLVLLGAAFGYYLFNKGPVDVKNSSSIKAKAEKLYEEFNTDPPSALKKYVDKVLQVTGEVTASSLNQKNEKIVLLKTGIGGASINCTMEEDPGNIQINDKLTIKGICSGMGEGDAEFGIKGDIYLTRCYLIK